MTTLIWVAAGFCLFATALHLASIAGAVVRCRPRPDLPAAPDAPAVTLIRPVCGNDNYGEETLRSGFELDHPRYELIFCVARPDDPAAPVVRRLMMEYPGVDARLLVGDERISINPKLNNVFKGWNAARHDWIVIADSNVLMPRDYIARLLARCTPDTGLVCAPPIGCLPDGFWAELECAFLNSYQARWQYLADNVGLGFAQGKTLFWRRDVLERAGGIRVLGGEAAEDAAATKVVRAAGLNVRLADVSFGQPLGRRSFRDVWSRQMRWAQLRRASFPLYFIPEVLSGGIVPIALGAASAALAGYSAVGAFAALAMLWYGAETLFVYYTGWHLSWRTPLAAFLRDLMIPVLWLNGWRVDGFVWRGNVMDVAESVRTS